MGQLWSLAPNTEGTNSELASAQLLWGKKNNAQLPDQRGLSPDTQEPETPKLEAALAKGLRRLCYRGYWEEATPGLGGRALLANTGSAAQPQQHTAGENNSTGLPALNTTLKHFEVLHLLCTALIQAQTWHRGSLNSEFYTWNAFHTNYFQEGGWSREEWNSAHEQWLSHWYLHQLARQHPALLLHLPEWDIHQPRSEEKIQCLIPHRVSGKALVESTQVPDLILTP